MAKLRRAIVPDVPHHVTQRGNRRQPVFFGDDDYRLYLKLLGEHCRARGVAVWAWCLMPNHVHMILVPPSAEAMTAAIADTHRRRARQAPQPASPPTLRTTAPHRRTPPARAAKPRHPAPAPLPPSTTLPEKPQHPVNTPPQQSRGGAGEIISPAFLSSTTPRRSCRSAVGTACRAIISDSYANSCVDIQIPEACVIYRFISARVVPLYDT
jgi:REP element-mobilizing transposase RayT